MSEPHDSEAPMQGHDYDGITELDNKLPRWWVWLFYLTILYGAIYLVFYHVIGVGDLQIGAYQAEVKAAAAARVAHDIAEHIGSGTNTLGTPSIYQTTPEGAPQVSAVPASDPSEPATDEATLAKGRTVYMTNCLPCHGDKGQGLIGPNFTDNWFLHGPAYSDTLRTIREGVIAKGMVPWKGVLKPEEVLNVASFIHSLRGTNPPNPKPPEPGSTQHPTKG